uniref:NB-ARC domain-containing protein n=1 Tax=Oryza punctata TaxID=4537 RepID=A0A0E0KM59_ORYPU
MHDLLHDLAVRISGTDCFRVEDGDQMKEFPPDVHHLFVSSYDPMKLIEQICKLKRLRTLIIFYGSVTIEALECTMKKLKKLRVVQVHVDGQMLMIPHVCDLIHLRSLTFSGFTLRKLHLPRNWDKLYHLQILDLPHGVLEFSRVVNMSNLPLPTITAQTVGNIWLRWIKYPSWLRQSFRCLQRLEIKECFNLEALPDIDEFFIHLRTLALLHLPKLEILPRLPDRLKRLDIKQCHSLVLTCVEDVVMIRSLLIEQASHIDRSLIITIHPEEIDRFANDRPVRFHKIVLDVFGRCERLPLRWCLVQSH